MKVGLSCIDGCWRQPITARRPTDAILQPRTVSTTGEFSAAAVSSGRRSAVHGRSFRRSRRASTDSDGRHLARQDLFASGDAVGVLGPGAQRRSFVSRRGRPLDRPSPFARTTSVLARRRARTARLESVCRNNSSRRWPAWSGAPWTPRSDSQWLWKGRRVYMFDGTTVSMPDTPENQAAYPQVYNQKPGLGFPIARIGVITSLACGAVLNLGFCRYAGKGQGEVSLLRRLWDVLRRGDVLLADSLLSNWTGIVLLQRARRRLGQSAQQSPPESRFSSWNPPGRRRSYRPLA